MRIRVFTPDSVSEYSPDGLDAFSVGSGPSDRLSLPHSDLVPGHVTFIREGGAWRMRCAGGVTAHGKRVGDGTLAVPEAYVLSRGGRIVLVAYEPGDVRRVRLSPSACPITVGRAGENAIVISGQSVSKRHCTVVHRDGAYFVEDAGSSLGTFVGGKRLSGTRRLENGASVVVGHATLRLDGQILEIIVPRSAECHVRVKAAPDGQGDADRKSDGRKPQADAGRKYVVYQRSPRLKQAMPTVDVEIDPPPSVGGKPEINWLSTLLPALVTVGMSLFASAAMPTMMIYSLPMTAGGVIVAVMNYRKQTAKFEEKQATRLKKYTEHLDNAVQKIEKAQKYQLKTMLAADPETENCFDVIKQLDRTLWDRRPEDEDFCAVRIGSGQVRSAAAIKVPKATVTIEDDELRERPEKIKKNYAHVKGAPIVCNLRESHICGIVGNRQDAISLLRNMLVQFAAHHSYTEARLVCAYDGADEAQLGWVRDLPHAMDEERETAFVSTSKAEAAVLFERYADLLKGRRLALESDNSYGGAGQMLPYCLFVVAQPAFLDKDSPINDYLLRRSDLGAGMIMVVDDITQLPKECNCIIKVSGNMGEMFDKNEAAHRQKFTVDRASSGRFAAFGKRMKHIKCDEPGKKSAIPKKYTFYDMQGIGDIGDWDLSAHWKRSGVIRSMAAPIGICEGGKLLELDILDQSGSHQFAHGPHGLVAGTTGSGKSEVMLSYLLSLALCYPPSEVSFMIIDFKGGGMVNQLAGLPHLAGTITNIDTDEIARSLASIHAELVRRQRLFADAKVDHIDDYIRLYKAGRAGALPHLIILVDEFAELKAAHPDVMADLISASRIGRSLGCHLILSTQKPSGQVSEDIRSNSNFQICLRVASREDSNEVINSPLAFNIKEPGRAYLRVGNNEVFELFQSGYSGAKASGGGTQLDAVVDHIVSYCRNNGVKGAPRIFLPPLPDALDMPSPPAVDKERGLLSVGLFDAPEEQCQGELMLDIFRRNTFILGSALSGKTNLLQAIIRGVGDHYAPDEVSIYILDFASMSLKNFEGLCHVGGVVTSQEDEKLKNLLKLINAEIEERRARFLELGVSSYAAYWEAGKRDKPWILLMIDNLTALRELYFTDDDPLLPLCQNGLAYGISIVATNAQTAGVGYKYMANFANRVAMYCNDSGQYGEFFDGRCDKRIRNVPGRCIVELEKKLYQAQIYRAFAGEKEVERAQSIRAWVDAIGGKHAGRAVPIPEIPDVLTEEAFLRAYGLRMRERGVYALGLDYETVGPAEVDFRTVGMLGIAGKDAAGPRAAVRWLLRATEALFPDEAEFYIADSIGKGMADLAQRTPVAGYEFLPARIPDLVSSVEAELAHRYDALMRGEGDLDREKLLVLVLAGTTSVDAVCGDAGALAAYKNIIGKYKALKVCVLLTELENAAINYSSSEILKKLKEEQRLLYFGDLGGLKLFDVPYAATKKFKRPLGRGDGYLLMGGECDRLKTPSA